MYMYTCTHYTQYHLSRPQTVVLRNLYLHCTNVQDCLGLFSLSLMYQVCLRLSRDFLKVAICTPPSPHISALVPGPPSPGISQDNLGHPAIRTCKCTGPWSSQSWDIPGQPGTSRLSQAVGARGDPKHCVILIDGVQRRKSKRLKYFNIK